MPAPDRLRVRPAPGRLIFVPETGRPLAAEGEVVVLSPFWRRRLVDGDVVHVSLPIAPLPAVDRTALSPDPEASVEEPVLDVPLLSDDPVAPVSPPVDEDLPAEPASAREDP